MDSVAMRVFMQQSSWFVDIPEEVLDGLLAAVRFETMPANTYLWSMGDRTTDVFGVMSGRVRTAVSSVMGHEFVLNDCEAGSWLGAPFVVNDYERLIDAKTLVASDILVISQQSMQAVGEAWPVLYRNLLRHNVDDARGLYILLTGMAFYPLRARVAGRLLELGREHGSELEGGVLLGAKLSQNDVARLTVGSRQRVNRIFREWEKSGLVATRGGFLWIRDIIALEKEIVPFE
jgi:CRP/FNR family cyclic AMP-dependent transcriptional regulator